MSSWLVGIFFFFLRYNSSIILFFFLDFIYNFKCYSYANNNNIIKLPVALCQRKIGEPPRQILRLSTNPYTDRQLRALWPSTTLNRVAGYDTIPPELKKCKLVLWKCPLLSVIDWFFIFFYIFLQSWYLRFLYHNNLVCLAY